MKKNELLKQIVYIFLKIVIIICLIIQVKNRNWNNTTICILGLILSETPNLIKYYYNIELTTTLEVLFYIFIFCAQILGEMANFYSKFPYLDTILHIVSGFTMAGFGFALVNILNKNQNIHKKLEHTFIMLFAICFSMTIGVIWEFCEFTIDQTLGKDMQKDQIIRNISSTKINKNQVNDPITINNIDKTTIYTRSKETTLDGYLDIGLVDTMKDLYVNLLGAFIFSLMIKYDLKSEKKYNLTKFFMPRLMKDE